MIAYQYENINAYYDDKTKQEAIKLCHKYYLDKYHSLNNDGAKMLELVAGKKLAELCSMAGGLTTDYEIIKGKYGKPYFNGVNNLFFSVSHSKDMVMVALSDKEVGCDIEKIKYDKDVMKIAKRFYNDREYDYLCNIKDAVRRNEAFYKIWTMKEAFVKAIGTGFNVNSNSYSMIDSNGKFINERVLISDIMDSIPESWENETIDYISQKIEFIHLDAIDGYSEALCILN